ncbi:ras-related protein Rab-30-like [Rhopilema esculentum]|uniref:ras-related protein Rab-30-like n=1 Tax=Rhopilema esculentum TaxID=499914 RepID=UPI0031D196BB
MSLYKVCLIGKYGVGKTTIFNRIRGKPNKKNAEIEFYDHDVTVVVGDDEVEKQQVTLQIWDTAGMEQYESMTESYYKDVHAIVAVFSLDSEKSFKKIKPTVSKIINDDFSPKAIFVLVGNKKDLDTPTVSDSKVNDFLKSNPGFFKEYLKISAHSDEDVSEVFNRVAYGIVREKIKPVERTSGGGFQERIHKKASCC